MPDDDSSLIVMTANLGNDFAPDERVIEALRASDAEIVGLQELNRRQAEVVAEALEDIFPYTAFFGDSHEGRGVLSRFPIESAELVNFVADRPDVLALVDPGSVPLTVIVGHPRPQVMRRGRVQFERSSLRQLLQLGHLAQGRPPTLLLGDFNMSPRHPGYARLQKLGLVDAYAEAGAGTGRTFPIRMRVPRPGGDREGARVVRTPPVKRFDYIWHTPELETDAAWIGPDTGSDHASVMARIILPEGVERPRRRSRGDADGYNATDGTDRSRSPATEGSARAQDHGNGGDSDDGPAAGRVRR